MKRTRDEVGERVDSLVPMSTAERDNLVDAMDGNDAIDEIDPLTKLGIMSTAERYLIIVGRIGEL